MKQDKPNVVFILMENLDYGEVGYYSSRPTRGESETSVLPDYNAQKSRFNGKFNWVQIDLGDDAKDADRFIDHEERLRVVMARQ